MVQLLVDHVLPAAYSVLPSKLKSRAATALLLAIGLQESRLLNRRQIEGPARSFWMFEASGARGVLAHPAVDSMIRDAGRALCYPDLSIYGNGGLLEMLEHNDVLAACFARCLLWTSPAELPLEHQAPAGWGLYTQLWRPGRPRPETWDAFYTEAWVRSGVLDNNARLT